MFDKKYFLIDLGALRLWEGPERFDVDPVHEGILSRWKGLRHYEEYDIYEGSRQCYCLRNRYESWLIRELYENQRIRRLK
jgi:hypothetical protein